MSEKGVLEGCPRGAVVEEFERTVYIYAFPCQKNTYNKYELYIDMFV